MKHRLEYHAFVFHSFPSKINQKTKPDACSAKFIKNLSLMQSLISRIRFQFHDDLTFNKQISRIVAHDNFLVLDFDFGLKLDSDPARFKLHLHGALVNTLEKPIAKDIVNFKSRTNDLPRNGL